ncbi:MAG: folP [Rickettsiales bacterium]|jgi:2-amino-4-hydroxy-6-hydroxymethyldihydropteridine diphosphokinase|nr:folP [Rickettsiales bacterium]
MEVILGLGSNIENRLDYLHQAAELLAGIHGETILLKMECSPVYETDALLPEDAPKEWDVPYYNMVVKGECRLTPEGLLESVKRIEKVIGRQDRGHWGPREIDIDILSYGNRVMETERLSIPHKGLLTRAFALIPFADVAPSWKYPVPGEYYGKKASILAKRDGFNTSGTRATNLRVAVAW